MSSLTFVRIRLLLPSSHGEPTEEARRALQFESKDYDMMQRIATHAVCHAPRLQRAEMESELMDLFTPLLSLIAVANELAGPTLGAAPALFKGKRKRVVWFCLHCQRQASSSVQHHHAHVCSRDSFAVQARPQQTMCSAGTRAHPLLPHLRSRALHTHYSCTRHVARSRSSCSPP
jgi:hypothetical protein